MDVLTRTGSPPQSGPRYGHFLGRARGCGTVQELGVDEGTWRADIAAESSKRRYIYRMTTRRVFVWLCGASTAGTFIAKTGIIEFRQRPELPAASGRRAAGIMSSAEMEKLSEQTRQVLATLTPSELKELRKRFGNRLTALCATRSDAGGRLRGTVIR